MTDEVKEATPEASSAGEGEKKGNDDKRYIDDIVKWKTQYKGTKEELEAFKSKTESEQKELSTKLENTAKEKTMFEQKYIDAEVKAQAVAAGIKDIEFVKLIDKTDIKLDEKGNVIGVDKAITDMKTRKPDWFGSEKKVSSSSNAAFPEKETKAPVDARNMSSEDWKKNKSKFMAGQF